MQLAEHRQALWGQAPACRCGRGDTRRRARLDRRRHRARPSPLPAPPACRPWRRRRRRRGRLSSSCARLRRCECRRRRSAASPGMPLSKRGADLEQHQVGEAARRIARGRRQQRRQQRWAQRIEIGGDGVLKLARIVAAAEQCGLRARDEGEGDVSLKPRAASARRAVLVRRWAGGQNGTRDGTRAASSAPTAHASRPWMRTTSSTRSAGPSTSLRQEGGVTRSIVVAFDGEAEIGQDADDLGFAARRARPAASPRLARTRSVAPTVRQRPATTMSDGSPPHQFEDQLAWRVPSPAARIPGRRRARSGSAHRTGCRACARSRAVRDRIEISGFDEDVRRGFACSRSPRRP